MIKTPDIDNILLLCHAKQNECSLLQIQHGNFVPLDWGFTLYHDSRGDLGGG